MESRFASSHNAWNSRQPSRSSAVLGRMLAALALIMLLALVSPAADAAGTLTICYGSPGSALVPLAKQRDFYAAEGLDVEVRRFPSGKQALESMFAGTCELATVARTPFVHYSLRRNDFVAIAAIASTYDLERVIVRSDRGIRAPPDLRGRRIAVPEFTTAHYFLDVYLAANGMAPQDVRRVYLSADEVLAAFRRGEVDAAAHWEPNIQILARQFGARVRVFATPGLHTSPFLLVGGRDYVRNKQATVEHVLRALLRAERFVAARPDEAKASMADIFGATLDEIAAIGSMHNFRVSLEQPLPFILENAARWELGLLPPGRRPGMPDYLDFIDLNGLLAVKPEAVTIIH